MLQQDKRQALFQIERPSMKPSMKEKIIERYFKQKYPFDALEIKTKKMR